MTSLAICPFCGSVPTGFVDVEAQEDEYGQASPDCCEQYSFKTYLGPLVAVSTFTGDARIKRHADKVQSAFAAHWNAMRRASGWISVEDRLPPEEDGDYVVVWSDGDVTSSTFSQGAFRRFDGYPHPKYWQPLPELPK